MENPISDQKVTRSMILSCPIERLALSAAQIQIRLGVLYL